MDDELLKKTKAKKQKTIMTAVVVAAFLIAAFVGFSILGPGAGKKAENKTDGAVTVTVECKDLADHMEKLKKPSLKKYIPEDGVILDAAEYRFKKGETVYDALEAVCMREDVQLETSEDAVYKSRYIEGLGYLYEKDAGRNSGWIYTVNGKSPSYGASKVKLADKDEIVWHYTVDYEKEDDDAGM